MDLVTLDLHQFASFGQFPSKLRFYHQNLPGYLNISYVVSFWDTLPLIKLLEVMSMISFQSASHNILAFLFGLA